jgi:hypothetical protein
MHPGIAHTHRAASPRVNCDSKFTAVESVQPTRSNTHVPSSAVLSESQFIASACVQPYDAFADGGGATECTQLERLWRVADGL